jgi:hypothetical protein
MERPTFGIPCAGEPCALGHSRDSHCHMPMGKRLPNRLTVTEEARLDAQAVFDSFEGLVGDEEQAWDIVEIGRMLTGSTVEMIRQDV